MSELKLKNETEFDEISFDEILDEGFTTVPNAILNDKEISYKALGLYVQIIQYKNSGKHKIYMQGLEQLKSDKEASVRSGMKELIERGYITKTKLRNERGHIVGYRYVVHVQPIANTTLKPKLENPVLDCPELESHAHIIKIGLKENKKKENVVVVVTTNEQSQKLIDLYKSFKLEKRVMPHTVKFLKDNANKVEIEVWEQVFISASEDSVKKKYAYIKATIEELVLKGILSLKDYEVDRLIHKENQKANKTKIFAQNDTRKVDKKPKTSFHNVMDETFHKYTDDELASMSWNKLNISSSSSSNSVETPSELPKALNVQLEDAKLYAKNYMQSIEDYESGHSEFITFEGYLEYKELLADTLAIIEQLEKDIKKELPSLPTKIVQ